MDAGRRTFLAGGLLLFPATSALAQGGHSHDGGLYERLHQPGRIDRPELAAVQSVFDSPAPRAANPGRWFPRAPLPLPRSEMAWAVEHRGRMHLLGGYAEQRVDRPYHHACDAATDTWAVAAPLPRGANHVGVAVLEGRLYAIGGFIEQNRRPHAECFALEPDERTWRTIAPLPAACGSVACVALGGRLHGIGGAVGDEFATRKSVDGHLVYDPGRDRWEPRSPLPTARSGHGAVLYRGRIFVMGGEGTSRVFGQNEAWDPQRDAWEQYAPMPTPRHGLGAAVVGDAIHVAGGGPVMGGSVQSAVHEAFTLA